MAKVNFLDQFQDTEIDLSPLFTDYGIDFTNDQLTKIKIKNIFEVVKLDFKTFKNSKVFQTYVIQDNDTPEDIAKKFYGSVEYWWIVLISNNIKQPFTEWLLTETQLYDISKFLSLNQGRYSLDGYFNILNHQNEQKRTIKLLKKVYMTDLLKEIKRNGK